MAEEFAELEAGFVELGFAVAGGALEHGGDLVVLVAFDVVEDEDHAIAGGQGGDGALEGDAVDGAGEVEIAGAEVALGSVLVGGIDGVLEGDELEALFAELHEDEVNRKAVKPGGEGRLAAEAIDFAEEMKKGLLGHVLGLGYVAEHAQAEGVNAALMKRIKLGKCIRIAVLSALDGISFAGDRWVSFEQTRVRF